MDVYILISIIMNLLTFILYAIDKKRAIYGGWRVKEVTLLISTFIFGSIGGLFGMYLLRHKTNHWYFILINFLSLLIHIGLGIYILKVKGFVLI